MKTKQNRWKIHILALSLKNRQCGISTFKIEIKDIKVIVHEMSMGSSKMVDLFLTFGILNHSSHDETVKNDIKLKADYRIFNITICNWFD